MKSLGTLWGDCIKFRRCKMGINGHRQVGTDGLDLPGSFAGTLVPCIANYHPTSSLAFSGLHTFFFTFLWTPETKPNPAFWGAGEVRPADFQGQHLRGHQCHCHQRKPADANASQGSATPPPPLVELFLPEKLCHATSPQK